MQGFNEELINFIKNSQCKMFTPEYDKVYWCNGSFTVNKEFSDFLYERYCCINNRSDIVCVMVFMLLTAYVENRYSLQQGSSFKTIYESIPINNNTDRIVRGCFRLMKLMRNAYVHNSNDVVKNNNRYIFDFSRNFRGNTTHFHLEIDDDKLGLLYALIIMLIEGKSRLGTIGHYEELISKYFTDIVDNIGNSFTDEISDDINIFDRGIGLVKERRYIIESAEYEIIEEDRLLIKNSCIFKTNYEWESVDYKIKLNSMNYLIPRELLSDKHEIKIDCLERWKLC